MKEFYIAEADVPYEYHGNIIGFASSIEIAKQMIEDDCKRRYKNYSLEESLLSAYSIHNYRNSIDLKEKQEEKMQVLKDSGEHFTFICTYTNEHGDERDETYCISKVEMDNVKGKDYEVNKEG